MTILSHVKGFSKAGLLIALGTIGTYSSVGGGEA